LGKRPRSALNAGVGTIDSTFIESSYGGAGPVPNGYKRAVGCGVHALIDKASQVQAAEGARTLLPAAKEQFPQLGLVLGDKAYRQAPLKAFAAELDSELDGDSPPLPQGSSSKPTPLRWRIERYFAGWSSGVG